MLHLPIMKLFAIALLAAAALAQQHSHTAAGPMPLMTGLGDVHHAVSTRNPEAQRFFDQGLALIYGFNHEAAVRSFERAAELDPKCAMAWWGIGLALGPNINDPEIDRTREKRAYDAARQAQALAGGATDAERGYIGALAKRYSDDEKADVKKLAADYRDAMRGLARQYPDDPDAATLFAESAMDLRPWQLWSPDGTPAEGTPEIVATLRAVLERFPQHLGANHYYIHAVEASPDPAQAMQSAQRLEKAAPAAGHLVHMPAHIFMRTGDYHAASLSNTAGAQADRAYMETTGARGGMYDMYYAHNLHFLAVSCAMEGRFACAREAAGQVEALARPMLKSMPMAAFVASTTTLVLVRFRRWDEILKLAEPVDEPAVNRAMWRFARGLAYSAQGKSKEADAEAAAFEDLSKHVSKYVNFGLNNAPDVLKVANLTLQGRLAYARHDTATGTLKMRQAVEAEDALTYDEPPSWYLASRESLGGMLLMAGRAEEAEAVFREDLRRRPNGGRSLFGLAQSLKAQHKNAEAAAIDQQAAAAWKNADTKLRAADL